MPWEFDHETMDPDNIEGFDFVEEGQYHVEVTNVQEEGGKNDEMLIDFEVLAGTTANQEGKGYRDYFSKSSNAEKRALLFALATGLTTIEELKTCKAANRNPVIHFDNAVGRQLCIGLEAEEYEGKTRNKVGFRIWSIESPQAKSIPLNKGKLAEREPGGGDDPFGGGSDLGPAPDPPAPMTQPGDIGLDDLFGSPSPPTSPPSTSSGDDTPF